MKNKQKQLENKHKRLRIKEKKQIKAIGNRVEKKFSDTDQKLIVSLFSNNFLNKEAIYELNKVIEMENKLNKDDLIHKTGNKKKKKHMVFKSLKHSFFARELYNNDLSLDEALEQQLKLKDYIEIFKESKKPKESVKKEKKNIKS